LSLVDRFRVPGDPVPPKAAAIASAVAPSKVTLRQRLSKGEVEWSPDFDRIMKLPRRPRNDREEWEAWADELEQAADPLAAQVRGGVAGIVESLTAWLKKPEGTQKLREVQALLIWEAMQVGGAIGMIQTGGGKTLPGMLLPMAISDCKRAVILIPPDLRPQFAADWETYGKHWKLPNLAGGSSFVPGRPVLHVIAYSQLSHTKSSDLLDQINPDIVMGDEISSLRNFGTSKVRRFNRFFAEHPQTRFFGWDATVVANSIENFWHLLAMGLGEGSPVPLNHGEVKKWARALDPEDRDDEGYWLPGVLTQFCQRGDRGELTESVRSGFQRRLISTKGVVITEENALGIPLYFQQRVPPPMPAELKKHLTTLRRKSSDGGWKRPDGEELRTPTEVAAVAKQLAEGFWLYWAFPRGEPTEVIDDWFLRRQNWNRELRAKLLNPSVHMDSPKLCENAAYRWYAGGCTGCSRGPEQDHESTCRDIATHPLWPSYTYLDWIKVEHTVHHVTRIKWESDWLLEDAAAWGREAPGIIWVGHPEFGERLERMTGFRYFGGGDESAKEIIKADGKQSIICSVQSNKRGKNLQGAFWRNLIISFPSSNDTLEQLIGRSYRPGHCSDRVEVHYFLHTKELEGAFETALARAQFVAETTGGSQKLLYGKFLPAPGAP
jgi:hypothetical protein